MTPYWVRLAHAVIQQAFEDAMAPSLEARHRKWKPDAKKWLSGKGKPEDVEDLTFWCGLADVDPTTVHKAYQRMVTK